MRRRLAFSDAIIHSIGEGVCAIDSAGRFTFVNSVAERMLGWPEADLLGRHVHEIVPMADAADRPSRLLDAVESGEVTNVEEVFRRHDGTLLSVSVNSSPIVTAAEVSGAVVVFRDLTEHRDAAENLRVAREQAARLVALEQTKSEFLKLASHELRGPLAVLGGYLSMLEDGSVEPHAVLTILHGKVAEMEALVDKMLEAARLEEGRTQLELNAIDLRTVVSEVVRSAQQQSRPKHSIVLKAPREPVPVLADAARLEVLLTNLLDNAIKFSPDGGRVECNVSADRHWASFSVRDRGLGMTPQEMAHLFTRFGRPVTGKNSHIAGSGLGLYLARELARMHGGDIRAESEAGKGSTFTFVLPVARAERDAAKNRRLLARVRRPRRQTPERRAGVELAPSRAARPAVGG